MSIPLPSVEVLFTPADFDTLPGRDLSRTTCVVFDVLRATTSMIAALANGAAAIVPVSEISDALALRAKHPSVLLAGERHGLRIRAAQTGGVDFDFGNSPREFTAGKVRGKTIVTTTTNGTRALRACAEAQTTVVAAFLNLSAVAAWFETHPPESLVLVCAGTFEQAAYEDVLAAGALLELLEARFALTHAADSALIASKVWNLAKADPLEAVKSARNAKRLLSVPELADDVAFSFQRDTADVVAVLGKDGQVTVPARPRTLLGSDKAMKR
ncbi:MAG: 2-phosphosulfolactate phosphatase [Verrucomicrobia bacterium]|nr:2-phosphosulfolactate phosphatase [Verrucomicrobiota bacterium]